MRLLLYTDYKVNKAFKINHLAGLVVGVKRLFLWIPVLQGEMVVVSCFVLLTAVNYQAFKLSAILTSHGLIDRSFVLVMTSRSL